MRCFGEVNVPSSRAFWDDFDDEEENQPIQKLEWEWQTAEIAGPKKSDLFVIFEGNKILDFLKAVLLKDAKPVCSIYDKKIYLFVIGSKCICVSEEDISVSGEVLSLLTPWLDLAQKVVTVSLLSKTQYKSSNARDLDNQITFLRGITTQFEYAPELESPNFVSGIAAGASSWRSMANALVSSYLVYTDNSKLDSASSEPVLRLVKDIGLNCEAKYQPKNTGAHFLYM